MITLFVLLALAGGLLRLVLNWQLKKHWGVSIGVPQALAGALVLQTGLQLTQKLNRSLGSTAGR